MKFPAATLLAGPDTPPALGPESRPGVLPAAEVRLRVGEAVPGAPPALLALVLLWHDHHDAAHALVQDAAGGDGAWVHGMLHRREPDFWNAKYWFARVGARHPACAALGRRAAALPAAPEAAAVRGAVLADGGWGADAFVDAVAAARAGSAAAAWLRAAQAEEFRTLLDHLADGGGAP
jgi:hypothetical protein